MFIGHWAPAFAAAASVGTKQPSRLATLFIAAQLVDWLFFALLLTGTERMRMVPGTSVMNPMDLYHMPYTHSLIGSAAVALGFTALVWVSTSDRRASVIAGGVVLSHWFLDLLVHVPDLTLAGKPPKLGMGLWNYPAIEMPLELLLTFGALAWYASWRRPARLPLIVLGAMLVLLQAVNWFGPVEAEVTAGTSLLAFFAYGAATAAAWWVGKSEAFPRHSQLR